MRFHVTESLQRANYGAGMVAHVKYTLSHPVDRDVVLTLVTRRHVPAKMAVDVWSKRQEESARIAERVLRDLASLYGIDSDDAGVTHESE